MRQNLILSILSVALVVGLLSYITSSRGHATTASASDASATTALFTDDLHHFTLLYPKDVDVHSYDDGEGSHTFTFEGPSPGEGFQIFIVPYTHTDITPARFKIDDPSGVMQNAATTAVDGVPAKSFVGYNDQMGTTSEVWFIHNGFLYELTTYKGFHAWLTQAAQSWQFI